MEDKKPTKMRYPRSYIYLIWKEQRTTGFGTSRSMDKKTSYKVRKRIGLGD